MKELKHKINANLNIFSNKGMYRFKGKEMQKVVCSSSKSQNFVKTKKKRAFSNSFRYRQETKRLVRNSYPQ